MAAIEDLIMTATVALLVHAQNPLGMRCAPSHAGSMPAVTGRIGRLDIDPPSLVEADRTAGDKCGSGGRPTKSNLRVSHGRENNSQCAGRFLAGPRPAMPRSQP
jgi:hypothetical protein